MAGINIDCDADVDPGTISRPTCFVTVELPFVISTATAPTTGPTPAFTLITFAYQLLILEAEVAANGRVIQWRPTEQTKVLLSRQTSRPNDRGILMHLTLKGNFIWARDDATLFLNGTVFGIRRQGITRTDLQLPSGDCGRGGDFQMWFWLTPGVQLVSLGLRPAVVLGGTNSEGTVTLSGPASAGGLTVNLGSDNGTIAEVPSNIVLAAGATTAQFVVQTKPVPGQVNIQASLTGGAPQKAALTSVTLAGLAFPPPKTVKRGESTQGTVSLSGPAPAGGALVALSAKATVGGVGVNPSLVATFPNSVLVPEGQASVPFKLSLLSSPPNISVTAEWLVSIAASLEGLTQADTVTKPSEIG
jgi:hypothetical protein